MATIQTINIGATANDNTGDPLRTAFDKTNQNNTSINNDLASKATIANLALKAPIDNPSFTGTLGTSGDAFINDVKVGNGGGNITTNTVVGRLALEVNTTGYNNVSIGSQNLNKNTTGYGNTSVGGSSMFNNTVNYLNTAIGFGAMSSNNAYNNATCIGNASQISGDNQIQLGNSSTTTYVYGTVQNRSDLRDKADVKDTILGLDFICKLRPVDYRWDMREDYKDELPIKGELSDEDFKIEMDLWLEKNKLANLKQDGSKKRNRFHHGFIAQEVRDLGIEFGGFQDHSLKGGEDVLSIGYDEFIAPMIKAIQELKAEIELLKAK